MRRDVDRQREPADLFLELHDAVHESSMLLNSIQNSLDLRGVIRRSTASDCK
jgi:hypothetical protein